jgi:hypothetical protein
MASSEILKILPAIDELRKLSQALAMLDAILSPEWEYRYYSFNSKWDSDEMLASMRNGSGDGYFLLFNPAGAILKGFDHESPMSPYASQWGKVWPEVLDGVPAEFQNFLAEPAFSMEDTTFCLWRRHGDPAWQTGQISYPQGEDPDGSVDLLSILGGTAAAYQAFAREYYEQEIDLAAIQHIYDGKPLTSGIVKSLNENLDLDDLDADIEEIGYPRSR